VVNLSDVETFFPERRPFFIEGSDIFNQFGAAGPAANWSFNWPNPTSSTAAASAARPRAACPITTTPTSRRRRHHRRRQADGRSGAWTIGTLHAFTERESARYLAGGAETRLEVEPFSYLRRGPGPARARRRPHGIGLLGTVTARPARRPAPPRAAQRNAVVGGLDGGRCSGARRCGR
jgi:hypothetical protein